MVYSLNHRHILFIKLRDLFVYLLHINHKSIRMKFVIKTIIVFIIAITISACNSTGGVWLGEGENSGKPYTFGPEEDIKLLQNLAGAYSEKNADELSKYYSEEYMNDKRKENYSKWLNSMESITMKPYKIIPLQNGGNFRQVIAWSKEERVHKLSLIHI